MENFNLYNPVKLHFGRGVTDKLGQHALQYGKKALLLYGKGSVKKNGAYEQVIYSLKAAGIEIIEFDGIKPNPVVEDVDAASVLGRTHQVEMIVAVGGGSVIDSGKMIAITIPTDHSAWVFAGDNKNKPDTALPLLSVLTLAATGTEMNPYAVIQNDALQVKTGYGHPLMFPRHSFLDPAFTLSVPATQTAYGMADLIAHSLEAWFGEGEAPLSDRFIASIIKETMEAGPALLQDLQNYELRARIMYAATCALNGMTVPGRKSQDWGVHAIGHCLSVKWDIAHGASLTVAYPAWLRLQKDRIPGRIAELGEILFQVKSPEETIEQLKGLFRKFGCPVSLAEAGISADQAAQNELLQIMNKNDVNGLHHKLTQEDHRLLLKYMSEG